MLELFERPFDVREEIADLVRLRQIVSCAKLQELRHPMTDRIAADREGAQFVGADGRCIRSNQARYTVDTLYSMPRRSIFR